MANGGADASQGEGWWQASDGKWYPPQTANASIPPPHRNQWTDPHEFAGLVAVYRPRAISEVIDALQKQGHGDTRPCLAQLLRKRLEPGLFLGAAGLGADFLQGTR